MVIKENQMKLFIVLLLCLILPQGILARSICELSAETFKVIFNSTRNAFQITADNIGQENIDFFHAKKCPCSQKDEYCPIGNGENVCSVHMWSFEPHPETYCYRQTLWEKVLGLVYLPSILCMAIVVMMPFTTRLGKNSFEYIFSTCFPCMRRRHLNRIIRREIQAITEHIELENSFERDDGKIEQTILKLKTKPIHQDHQFTYEDKNCLICMVGLEEGDRIGDLSCQHNFHADCLKEWIKRRNACPLCNTQVADTEVVLVDKEEVMNGEDDNREIDEEARNRFDQVTAFYRLRTSRRIRYQ